MKIKGKTIRKSIIFIVIIVAIIILIMTLITKDKYKIDKLSNKEKNIALNKQTEIVDGTATLIIPKYEANETIVADLDMFLSKYYKILGFSCLEGKYFKYVGKCIMGGAFK